MSEFSLCNFFCLLLEVLAAKDLENFAQETGSDVIKKESLGGTTRDDIGSSESNILHTFKFFIHKRN
ncbi:hypothetical protein H4Q26_017658 [Puccinia striiformis f. sp. tritici PST-130]|nr:hypothetical protein H4Q26_017658 [Puccinia striiformis f. sp. tritici PST-130]